MPPQAAPPARILLTRPAEQSARFADQLRKRFGDRIDIVESPLLSIRYLTPDLPPGPFSAVAFTSESAVAAARPLRPRLPAKAYTVGDRTAAAARAAGFDAVSAQGDADALVALILADRPGPILHLHGSETRGEVVPRLAAAGLPAAGAVVYVQEDQPLAPAARRWLDDPHPVIAALFSPRTAALFAAGTATATAPLWLVSLSPAVDAAAPPAAIRRIAARPDAAAVIAAIAALLDGPPEA